MTTHPTKEPQLKARPVTAGLAKKSATPTTSSKPSVSVCDDLQALIAKRAYALHVERGCRDGYALDDWLEAERQILGQIPPA